MEPLKNVNTGQPCSTVPFPVSDETVEHLNGLYEEINRRFGVDRDAIETILPCTPFQYDVLDCAANDARHAVGHATYEISQHVHIQRLIAAWRETVRRTPALRACTFTSTTGESFQLVLRESFVLSRIYWSSSSSLTTAVLKDETAAAVSGPRCNRLVLLEDPDTKKQLLIWVFHLALVDSTVQEPILRRVLAAYKSEDDQLDSLPLTPDSSGGSDSDSPSTLLKMPRAFDQEKATQFWQRQLSGLDASVFPPLSSHLTTPKADAKIEHYISWPASAAQHKWSSTTVCQAALAVLLSRYSHSPEALFGVVTEQVCMFEGQRLLINGPTRSVVPFRVHCGPEQSVTDLLKSIASDNHDMRQFAHVGLCNMSRIGDDQSAACRFQTVLSVTNRRSSEDAASGGEILQILQESEGFAPCANRALLLRCETSRQGALLVARYDRGVIEPPQMARFLRQLGWLMEQLQSAADDALSVKQLDIVTREDRAEIDSWNSDALEVQESLLHSAFVKRAAEFPSDPAVFSWDGAWTYSELDNVSSRLAAHIQSLDLSHEQLIVPVYFEKSKWVVASILAVLKAGHAFTLIDPKDPPARTTQIVQQTSAKVALTSKLHQDTVQAIVGRCIVVDDDFVQSLASASQYQEKSEFTAKPHNLAYAIFTSGSTGDPKGIMIEHRAFASCVAKFGPALIPHNARALQFASHGFGACLLEILPTLLRGGCVCIPSDHDRMHNIPDFIRRYNVNWMMATPSYMTTFNPEDVPGLQTLILVGEQMSASVNATWASRLGLFDGYGQSESCSICFIGKISPVSEANNIGRAVGAHSWIVHPDDPERLAPVGAVGELLIESPGIARGYIAAPATDRNPFLETAPAWYAPRQLPAGVKFYRTGDLARYAADGTVVCLGRIDSQVKIRGQRVEMGAVETRLRQQLPSDITVVAEAVKRSDSSGSTAITAFLIDSSETNNVSAASAKDARILDQIATQEMNEKLCQVLPPHSVPSCYICMHALPRTATGKVDRKTLRSIGSKLLEQQADRKSPETMQKSKSAETLETGLEARLKEVWLQSFNLEPASPKCGASFFELGGDSITAIKMVNMARAAGLELKVSDIFQNPTLARLQAVMSGDSTPSTTITTFATIPASTWDGPVEQSYSQGRLWFLDQLDIGAVWYLIPYAVRMRGALDIDALRAALLALEQRHETLRTTFENQNGVGVQIVHQRLAKELKIIDASSHGDDGYLQPLEQEQTTPFDLTSEAGWRASLICVGEDHHVLSIVMHHIVSDGWSIDVLRQELGQLYAAVLHGDEDPLSAVSPLPIQYRDFSMWQRRQQVAEHDRQLQYWRKQLADCSPAKLPTDFPRPPLLSGDAGSVPVEISGELFQKLHRFCNVTSTTPFAVLLAAFRAAHYRLTGVDDAVVGTPIANRNRPELERLIGFFVNTQCMRITVDDDDTFEGLVRQVRRTTTEAFENEDVPFERVVSAMLPAGGGSRDLSQTPLAQLIFAVHSQENLGKFELQGLESEPVANKAYTRFDAEFHLFQTRDGLNGYLNFAAELFKLETMQNVVSVFIQILRHGLEQPKSLISVLPLADGLKELDNMGLLKIHRGLEYQRDSSLVDIFRSQVATCPDTIAVIDSSSRLTYAQLDHQSNLLEAWIRRKGLPAESLVGVLSPRSCETIIAFLGILKANLAYLPLDPKSPVSRMRDVLSDLPGHTIILLGSDVAAPDLELPCLELVRISDALKSGASAVNGSETTDLSAPSANSLAYVLYTSGSTGRPKGVMVEHRAIVRLVQRGVIPNFPPLRGAIMAHLFNTVFDGATYEIFLMLLNGGTLVCIDYLTTLSPKALETVFLREGINCAIMTPALLKLYLANARDGLKGLDMLMVAGDRFDPQDAVEAQTLVRGDCYNAYGPTENGVMSTLYKIDTSDSFINGVPLGRAIDNSGAYITDPNQQLVGPGVLGELIVTGDGLARGYTDPALDRDRFIQVVINGESVRAYRTGDRMRYRAGQDCLFEFFGRMDFQFKIRSNRIESAEVEAAILSHTLVRDAAIVVVGVQEEQEPEMVGFVVAADDAVEQEATDNQVEGWQELFESSMYNGIDAISPSALGKDFTGWTSMYDGSEIDKSEMQEWLDDTIHTLRDGHVPGHVLEIGTGTGMILFNLGSVESYVGLEPTKSAVEFVNKAIKTLPNLAGRAEVHIGTATDIDQLSGLRPDLVILNSVVQYFPTVEYLTRVVDALVRIRGVKRLFFGDVRSQALHRQFLAACAMHALGKTATRDDVRRYMAEREEREEELLVEPAFFTALTNRHPNLIQHVEILPKNIRATNELSAYRYAAVVHLRDPESAARPVYPIAADDWVDFQASQMRSDVLREYLRLSAGADTVAVCNIPYDKTIFERLIVESLDDNTGSDAPQSRLDGRSLDGAPWISAVRCDAESRAFLSVPDLVQLAAESGFQVQVSAARQWSQSGALDAVFHRRHASSSQPTMRTLFQFPDDNALRASATLTNRPLQRLQRRRVAAQIRERLQTLVPSYMIPAKIVVLDQMPLNANGKVDRKELARRARTTTTTTKKKKKKSQRLASAPACPISDIEVALCEEATATFGMQVGISDHFFKLGGHSLLATKLISRVGDRLKARLTVKDVFDHPIFSELAVVIREGLQNVVPVALNGGGQAKQGSAGVVAPRNEMETMLCEEFANVLGMDVGVTDNFFDLGGHSLMATKLAARIGRRLNTTISVKEVFEHPIVFQLANSLELGQLESDRVKHTMLADYTAYQLLSVEDLQGFLQNEISPQLECAHGGIQDVYPATHMQKAFLCDASTGHPKPLVPFYIDFPPDSDCATLVEACSSLVKRFDMFRTVVVEAAGELYQVVLEHFDLQIDVVETEENVHAATNDFVDRILEVPVHLGQPLIQFTILKQASSVRVLLCLSHALYDGLSLEHVVRDLHMLYKGRSLLPANQFSRYMQYMDHTRKAGCDFWRDVIQDTPITVLGDVDAGGRELEVKAARTLHATKIIGIPLQAVRSSIITQATVFNAACALVLSRETGAKDVVFGRIVSGRQGLPVSWQNIVGPCTNAVPVRARINDNDDDDNHRQMLRDMQDQYLLSLPFETLDFDEVRRSCTNWPATANNYACCVTYHDFSYHPESEMEKQRVEMGVLARKDALLKEEPVYDLGIAGEVEPDGVHLQVTVVAKTRLFSKERAAYLMEEVCRLFESLNSAL